MYTSIEVIYGILVPCPLNEQESDRLFFEEGENIVEYYEDLLTLTALKKKTVGKRA